MHKDFNDIFIYDLQKIISETIQNELSKLKLFPNREFLTREQVKDRLNITYPTLNDYTRRGKLRGYRIGGRVLYKSDEVEQALTAIEPRLV